MEKTSKKILILRFGALGDIVHTTIIPQAIKAKYPNYEVHYCSESRYLHVIKNNPNIDKIIEFDHKRKKDIFYNFSIAQKLKSETYDVILNLTNALRNNLMTLYANPKQSFKKLPMGNRHAVEAFFLSAKQAFPELTLPKNLQLGVDEKIAESVSKKISEYPRPYFVFSPGGETDLNRQGRTWPAKYWCELGNLLHRIFGGTIFVTGSPSERDFHKKIVINTEGAILCSGDFSIAESMSLFSLCDLFISGDSGPLHIASGLGKNTIGILGSTAPENIAPYGEHGFYVEPRISCKYCWQKKCKKLQEGEKYTPCMKSIKPENILDLINRHKLL